MAKFKVLKRYRDTHTKVVQEVGAEIEMTVKRSEELASNLDDTYLERLDVPEPEANKVEAPKKQGKAEADK